MQSESKFQLPNMPLFAQDNLHFILKQPVHWYSAFTYGDCFSQWATSNDQVAAIHTEVLGHFKKNWFSRAWSWLFNLNSIRTKARFIALVKSLPNEVFSSVLGADSTYAYFNRAVELTPHFKIDSAHSLRVPFYPQIVALWYTVTNWINSKNNEDSIMWNCFFKDDVLPDSPLRSSMRFDQRLNMPEAKLVTSVEGSMHVVAKPPEAMKLKAYYSAQQLFHQLLKIFPWLQSELKRCSEYAGTSEDPALLLATRLFFCIAILWKKNKLEVFGKTRFENFYYRLCDEFAILHDVSIKLPVLAEQKQLVEYNPSVLKYSNYLSYVKKQSALQSFVSQYVSICNILGVNHWQVNRTYLLTVLHQLKREVLFDNESLERLENCGQLTDDQLMAITEICRRLLPLLTHIDKQLGDIREKDFQASLRQFAPKLAAGPIRQLSRNKGVFDKNLRTVKLLYLQYAYAINRDLVLGYIRLCKLYRLNWYKSTLDDLTQAYNQAKASIFEQEAWPRVIEDNFDMYPSFKAMSKFLEVSPWIINTIKPLNPDFWKAAKVYAYHYGKAEINKIKNYSSVLRKAKYHTEKCKANPKLNYPVPSIVSKRKYEYFSWYEDFHMKIHCNRNLYHHRARGVIAYWLGVVGLELTNVIPGLAEICKGRNRLKLQAHPDKLIRAAKVGDATKNAVNALLNYIPEITLLEYLLRRYPQVAYSMMSFEHGVGVHAFILYKWNCGKSYRNYFFTQREYLQQRISAEIKGVVQPEYKLPVPPKVYMPREEDFPEEDKDDGAEHGVASGF